MANIREVLYTKFQQEIVLVLENALKCVLNSEIVGLVSNPSSLDHMYLLLFSEQVVEKVRS